MAGMIGSGDGDYAYPSYGVVSTEDQTGIDELNDETFGNATEEFNWETATVKPGDDILFGNDDSSGSEPDKQQLERDFQHIMSDDEPDDPAIITMHSKRIPTKNKPMTSDLFNASTSHDIWGSPAALGSSYPPMVESLHQRVRNDSQSDVETAFYSPDIIAEPSTVTPPPSVLSMPGSAMTLEELERQLTQQSIESKTDSIPDSANNNLNRWTPPAGGPPMPPASFTEDRHQQKVKTDNDSPRFSHPPPLQEPQGRGMMPTHHNHTMRMPPPGMGPHPGGFRGNHRNPNLHQRGPGPGMQGPPHNMRGPPMMRPPPGQFRPPPYGPSGVPSNPNFWYSQPPNHHQGYKGAVRYPPPGSPNHMYPHFPAAAPIAGGYPGGPPHPHRINQDPYAGLLTESEKDWLRRIQMLQLNTDNPYADDYYFTIYSMKKRYSKKTAGGAPDPNLIVPAKAKVQSREYKPTQFTGSLGRLTTSNVHKPRQILDIGGADEQFSHTTDTKKYRQALVHIEQAFQLLLDLDEYSKKLPSLPDDQTDEIQEEIITASSNLEALLLTNQSIFITIRKGRGVLIKSLSAVNPLAASQIIKCIADNASLVNKKEKLDPMSNCILEELEKYITSCDWQQTLSCCGLLAGQIRLLLRNTFGCTLICLLILNLHSHTTSGTSISDSEQASWKLFTEEFHSEVISAKRLSAPVNIAGVTFKEALRELGMSDSIAVINKWFIGMEEVS